MPNNKIILMNKIDELYVSTYNALNIAKFIKDTKSVEIDDTIKNLYASFRESAFATVLFYCGVISEYIKEEPDSELSKTLKECPVYDYMEMYVNEESKYAGIEVLDIKDGGLSKYVLSEMFDNLEAIINTDVLEDSYDDFIPHIKRIITLLDASIHGYSLIMYAYKPMTDYINNFTEEFTGIRSEYEYVKEISLRQMIYFDRLCYKTRKYIERLYESDVNLEQLKTFSKAMPVLRLLINHNIHLIHNTITELNYGLELADLSNENSEPISLDDMMDLILKTDHHIADYIFRSLEYGFKHKTHDAVLFGVILSKDIQYPYDTKSPRYNILIDFDHIIAYNLIWKVFNIDDIFKDVRSLDDIDDIIPQFIDIINNIYEDPKMECHLLNKILLSLKNNYNTLFENISDEDKDKLSGDMSNIMERVVGKIADDATISAEEENLDPSKLN